MSRRHPDHRPDRPRGDARQRRRSLALAWRWLVGLCLVVFATGLHAQTMDDVQWLVQGDDLVARVTFNATVRFLQQTPVSAAALYQVTWDLVSADDALLKQSVDETRRVPARGAVPEFTLTYPASDGRRPKQLTVQFDSPVLLACRQGPSPRAIDLVFPGQAASAAAPALAPSQPVEAPAPVATPAIESQAAALMERARAALAAKAPDQAVQALDELLRLPPNSQSQSAQELAGVARERLGDLDRARVEYRLYLQLYPEGEGAERVRQRLASMGEVPPSAAAAPGSAAPAAAAASAASTYRNRFNGNIAQYYYGGKARSQSLVNLPAGIDQSTLSRTTESAIVTSVDLGARYEGADSDTRVVVRGTDSANLGSSSHAQSTLSAAYVDYKRNESGLAVRVGRQSAIGGGLLGLFDGLSLTYPVSQGWKVDVMGGAPSSVLVNVPKQRLAAAMVEADGILEHWGGDAYLIDQTTQGVTDRRALGTEVRYSDDVFSAYTLLDYDLLFHRVNAVSLQGSAQAPGQTTVTLLLDSRNAPSLDLTNALISTGTTSLKQLLQTQSLAQVRADALATTARARQALLSLSRPLAQKWQATVDLRYSDVGATPAVGNFEAMPATGAQYGLTVQLTGSNLYSQRDINNFDLSVLHAPTFKGEQLSYGNLTGLRGNDLTLEPTITWYHQHDDMDVTLRRAGLGMRCTYRISRRASVLGEGLFEHSNTRGPVNRDTTNSIFFYLGYRYDLF
ncbi:MAG: tetratricopeptide repeat protein [Burkholderiaceae bacterium]